jgi:hypothetical protein
MHHNAQSDLEIPLDAKQKFGVARLGTLFVDSIPIPHEHEKSVPVPPDDEN